MKWKNLDRMEQLDDIIRDSHDHTCVIYKHSTTCPINHAAKQRLDGGDFTATPDVDWYYLDLLALRPISNEVAERFGIKHESPQILVIKNGECLYNVSHHMIMPDQIQQNL